MNDFGKSVLFWKVAILKVSGKACMALLLSIVASLNGVEWATFTPTGKFMAIVVALGQMWTVIDAFLNETMSELKQKKMEENTQAFLKSDVKNP